ncbi:tail protein [Podophage Lau218]|uniref:Phage tail protein n=2 Tax=Lauvirus lau218 TaxID=1465639 RepID=A0A060BRS3_9CAUD|nr:tail protein [Podophage Lau218]AIA83153.1 phage tail protein [Podophage Lau218]AIA83201.1 phage tail protein [Lauvirus lau218]AIA83251.1 phage tail protein [Lauvirus lau218]
MNKLNDAINICLTAIGERPLTGNTSITGNFEAELASDIIEEAKVEVLSSGYQFNTDNNWELIPDNNNYIGIPPTALFVDPTGGENWIIQNEAGARQLYNKDDQTLLFTEKALVDIRWNIDFDDMPVVAQQLTVNIAKKKLYERIIGVDSILNIFAQEIQQSKVNLLADEINVGDYSYFDDNPKILNRISN